MILLAAALWHIEKRLRSPIDVKEAPFEDIIMDDVDFLSCERGDVRVECSLKSRGWFIDYPVKARADAAFISRLLSVLEGMKASEVITANQREERDLDLADYGLSSPAIRIKTGGRYFLREFQIGNSAPVGDAVYVRFSDESEVYAVPGDLTNAIPDSLSSFRDAYIIPGDSTKASRLEFHQPGGFVQLVRKADGWWIQQPFSAPADGAAVERILKKLFALRAEKYVWDPPVLENGNEAVQSGALLDVYGFADDVSPLRISVWLNGDEIGRELIIGKPVADDSDLLYARRKSFDSIFAVRKSEAPVTAVSAVDLRDKLVFPLEPASVIELGFEQGDSRLVLHRYPQAGWMISEPVQWRADDDYVNQMVSVLARLEVSSYGDSAPPKDLRQLRLDPPAFKICLSTNVCRQNPRVDDETKNGLRECCDKMVSFGTGDSNGLRHVKFSSGQMALIAKEQFAVVDPPRLTDPLLYRERTVLSIPSTSVRRIDREVNGVKESVVVSSNGVWSCVSHTNRQVSASVVSDVLLFAANLKAIGFESLNPKSLSGYGLEPPAVALTLGLSGDQGIQKTIMLGFKSGTDGIYGLIKGQDLLLTLNRDVAELLSRSLLVATPLPDLESTPAPKSGAGKE